MKPKINKVLNNNAEVIVMVIIALIVLTPLAYSIVSFASSGDVQGLQLSLEKPDEQYKECVEDTKYMRVNHMDLLKNVRIESVREGKRGEIELNKCRKCHTSRERFCIKCHDIVSIQLDCFNCHYYPE